MPSHETSLESGEYVIQDPHHKYAIEFIRRMRRKFGWRAVCFYTSPQGHRGHGHKELLSADMVLAKYHVRPGGLPSFIEHLAKHHDIRAVIPYKEEVVLNACQIATGLGLDWAQPDVIPLFRDKVACKAHLRKVAPDIRLNQFHLVRSVEEALKVTKESSVARFVLKPVDGGGNFGLGIFDSDVSVDILRQFWIDQNKTEMIWEEFVGGTEYQCNGQVDGTGNIQILEVSRLVYRSINGKENIRAGVMQVRYSDPIFASVAEYTRRVIQASGLRRNPFHAEVKIDDQGPCLIECAARLIGGASEAYLTNTRHHDRVDVFDMAAHGYATAEPYPESDYQLDWATYDSRLMSSLMGFSTQWARIYSLEGATEVEAMPEFRGWATVKPFIGQKIRPTLNLNEFPYVVHLQGQTSDALQQAASHIEHTLKWNQSPPTPLTWVAIGMSRILRIAGRVFARVRALGVRRLTIFG